MRVRYSAVFLYESSILIFAEDAGMNDVVFPVWGAPSPPDSSTALGQAARQLRDTAESKIRELC